MPVPTHHRTPRSFAFVAIATLGAAVSQTQASLTSASAPIDSESSTLTCYPGGASLVQKLKPRHTSRATGLDGASTGCGGTAAYQIAYTANSTEPRTPTLTMVGDVHVGSGTYLPTDVDISYSAPGVGRIAIGRSYNHNQGVGPLCGSTTLHNSDGSMGWNWFYNPQMEIVLHDDDGNDDAADVITMLIGGGKYLEFKRVGEDDGFENFFKGKNGTGGIIERKINVGTPDLYIYYDMEGQSTYFFGGDGESGNAKWQFWKIEDQAGNRAYVGDPTSAAAAKNSYRADGTIIDLYDGAGKRYYHEYYEVLLTGDTRDRLKEVHIETNAGGSWGPKGTEIPVSTVVYTYYTSTESGEGMEGDLKTVTVTTPLSDPNQSSIRRKYYRYYTGDNHPGYEHCVKMVLGYEGLRRYDYGVDSLFNNDYENASDATLKEYADVYLTYSTASSLRRVSSVWHSGMCGCGGSSLNGVYAFEYETNSDYIDNPSAYDASGEWWTRTTIQQPDGQWITQYFDEAVQPLSNVVTDNDPDSDPPPASWVTGIIRDANGWVSEVHTPAANDGYVHDNGDVVFASKSGSGLITLYERSFSPPHFLQGFLTGIRIKEGTGNTPIWLSSRTLAPYAKLFSGFTDDELALGATIVSEERKYVATTTVKDASGTYIRHTKGRTWIGSSFEDLAFMRHASMHYGVYDATGTIPSDVRSDTATQQYYRPDGSLIFSIAPDEFDLETEAMKGRVTYTEQNSEGLVSRVVRDANTADTYYDAGEEFSNWSFEAYQPNGWHVETDYGYDTQQRIDTVTAPDGRVSKMYYTQLKDRRLVTISIPYADGGTYYGPASYSVRNHAGKVEFSGTLVISGGSTSTPFADAFTGITLTSHGWIDETKDDPIQAVENPSVGTAVGTVSHVSTSLYDSTGTRILSNRKYHLIPSSGAGSKYTNYYETSYGYNATTGRQDRTVSDDGTVTRTVFDDIGRTIEKWVGLSDTGWPSSTGDMTKVEAIEYDNNQTGGNSYITKQKSFVDDSISRDTSFVHDYRGRVIATLNPVAPHAVNQYDNLNRVTAVATYSATTGLDEESLASGTTNRVGLTQMAYDVYGNVYKTTRHNINPTSGASTDTIEYRTWYDGEGRVIATKGQELSKRIYDRLGRQIRKYDLAVWPIITNSLQAFFLESSDIVLSESHTVYESNESNNVVMTASIEAHHDEDLSLTGGDPLDFDGDNNDFKYTMNTNTDVRGRISIAGMWYDALDRLTDSVAFGTNGGIAFDRKPSGTWLSVPARSDTALRTSTVYNHDGTVQQTIDPRGIATKYEYDDAGQQLTVIANYSAHTPPLTTPERDSNHYTRYEYFAGLQTAMWVDVDGDGNNDSGVDQVTEYIYGTTKGTNPSDSAVARNDLVQQVIYPPGDVGDETFSYAYNVQGQEIWRSEPGSTIDNIIKTTYDAGGRVTDRKADTLGDGLDSSVRRIQYAYNTRGLLETVTQYNHLTNVANSNLLDQVKYTYGDSTNGWTWDQVSMIEQDMNSAVGGSTPNDEYAVRFTYEKSAPNDGRQSVRRKTQRLLHNGTERHLVTYDYGTSGSYNDKLSRVYQVDLGSTPVHAAAYTYNGLNTLVRTDLPEADLFTTIDGSDSGAYRTYPNIDRFGRVIRSAWWKDGSPDVVRYNTALTYDRNSNILYADDAKLAGYDVKYSRDGLNRLTVAEEGTISGLPVPSNFDSELDFNDFNISSRTRQEDWTLTQTGNWKGTRLDLDGDNNFNETVGINLDKERDEARTHHLANEIDVRDPDNNPGTTNRTMAHNGRGDMTYDGGDFRFVYDAFGRLKKITGANGHLVTEYRYNGLGQRITYAYDNTWAGEVYDPWGAELTFLLDDDYRYWHVYDDRWRIVATVRVQGVGAAPDSRPKEVFTYHAAGLDGNGSASYIDSVISLETDLNPPSTTRGWTLSGSTLQSRYYYVQNWRADVVGLTSETGTLLEEIRYSAYGTPIHLLPETGGPDFNGDEAIDVNDLFDYINHWLAKCTDEDEPVEIECERSADFNEDGVVDVADLFAYINAWLAKSGDQVVTRGRLSADLIGNRKGYAGYDCETVFESTQGYTGFGGFNCRFYNVRNRVYDTLLGRWTKRDPIGYADGMNLYGYARGNPTGGSDPFGLCSQCCSSSTISQPGPRSCAPGWYYDPIRDQCVMDPMEWDCAANSIDFSQCISCCNQGKSSDPYFYGKCHRYCNRRFNPIDYNNIPFTPSPGADGPCFRESSGHPGCQQSCSYAIDGIMTPYITDGPNTTICCICDVSNPAVAQCKDIADCITERFKCFAFNKQLKESGGSVACRMAACGRPYIQCLRNKLAVASGGCRQHMEKQIEIWEDFVKPYEEQCANK